MEDPFTLRLDEIRLLAEAGFPAGAWSAANALLADAPDDPERLGLCGWLAHRDGRISAAVELWSKLHGSSPHAHAAMLRLSVLQREESPSTPRTERTDLPLVRRALRLVATGDHARALTSCADGGRLARAAHDDEQQKLLALLEALLLELSGKLSHAARALERLGDHPSFTRDLDRLAVLARVCERGGDQRGLRAAARVLTYLTEGEKLSAFPRLASVRRALGDDAGAQEAEAEFERVFLRRMQLLSAEARLAAAARCYVGAARLGRLLLPPLDAVDVLPSSAGVDEGSRAAAATEPLLVRAPAIARGVRLLVEGQAEEALSLLPSGGWRAEALVMSGASEAAVHALRSALPETAPHVRTPLALLFAKVIDTTGVTAADRPALALASEALDEEARFGPADAEREEARAVLAQASGDAIRAERHRRRACACRELGDAAPGTIRAAAIYALPGKPKGLVHDVIARRRLAPPGEGGRLIGAELFGELGPGVRAQLRRIFAAVRESLIERFPERAIELDRYSYGLHVTKEDEPSFGPSLGLPAAMAIASAMLELPVSRGLVFTGALSYDGLGKLSVRPVGEVGTKLKGALHAGAVTFVFPATQREEALAGQIVPREIAARAIAPVDTFDEALALIER